MMGPQSLPLAGLAAFGIAFAESGLGLGMVVPAETAVLAIAAAVDGPVATLVVFAAVVCGATAGDHLGYVLGRTQGPRLRGSRAVTRLGTDHWDRATRLLCEHGAGAVLATRLLPVVRTLTPAAAGCSGLRYPRFAVASVCGSMLWSAVYVGGGRVAVTALEALADSLGPLGWSLIGAASATAAVAVALLRRRIRARRVSTPRDRGAGLPRPAVPQPWGASVHPTRPGAGCGDLTQGALIDPAPARVPPHPARLCCGRSTEKTTPPSRPRRAGSGAETRSLIDAGSINAP